MTALNRVMSHIQPTLTMQELEHIEDCARRGFSINPEVMLRVTAYLRDVLQEKANAEAITSEVLSKAGIKSRYYAMPDGRMRRVS